MMVASRIALLLTIALSVGDVSSSSSTCSAPADIVLILDESGSVSSSNFALMKSFATTLIQNITVATDKSRVAVIAFSHVAREIFYLSTYTTNTDVTNAINNIVQSQGGTFTHAALDRARTSTFTAAKGDRSTIPNICIIVTDGQSAYTSSTATAAKAVQDAGIFLFAVGVGNAYKPELQAIASDPDEQYVFNIHDFDYLSDVAEKITPKSCAIAVTNGTIVGKSCTGDADCSNIQDTKCDTNACQCYPQSLTYDSEKLLCRVRGLGDQCITAAECANVSDSSCNCNSIVAGDTSCLFGALVCSCLSPFVSYNGECQKCELGTSCSVGRNCTTVIPKSACKPDSSTNVYIESCADGWIVNGASCRPIVVGVDPCQLSSDCPAKSSCMGGICVCDDPYSPSADKLSCSLLLSRACTSASDCLALPGAVCTSSACQCSSEYIEENFKCRPKVLGESCVTATDCANVSDSSCDSGTHVCSCLSPFVSYKGECQKCELRTSCSVGPDCTQAVPHSACKLDSISNAYVLSCVGGWVVNGSICRAMILGVDSCQLSSDCHANSLCTGGVCLCDKPYSASASNSACIARELYKVCATRSHCEDLVGADCISGQCQCGSAYLETNFKCRPKGLGDVCVTTSDCTMVGNSSCSCNSAVASDTSCLFGKFVCSCLPPFAKYNSECQKCELRARCLEGRDCTSVLPNSVCKVDLSASLNLIYTQSCAGGWVENGDSCRPMILGVDQCYSSADCAALASCQGGVCLCEREYTLVNANKTACRVRGLHEGCTNSTQCAGLVGAECNSGVCKCGLAYIEEDLTCRARGVGENCTNDGDCQAIQGFCGEFGQCNCSKGFIVTGVTCRKRLVGENCTESTDCSGVQFAICESSLGRCSCGSNTNKDNNTCVSALTGASSSEESGGGEAGAIAGGVIGSLAGIGVIGAGVGAAVLFTSSSAGAAAGGLSAMAAQSAACTAHVEAAFPGMTPGTTTALQSAPPNTIAFT